MKNFADRLLNSIDEKQNPSIIGMDSDFTKIPEFLKDESKRRFGETFEAVSKCIIEFNRRIINTVKDIVPAIKIQMAFYEKYGSKGIEAMEKTIRYAKNSGLIVVIDAKKNDIGNTAKSYSNGLIGTVDVFGKKMPSFDADCVTVNPYLGSDGINPFIDDLKRYGKGIFVLVKTSNPSSVELQNLESKNKKVYEIIAELVNRLGSRTEGLRGYTSVGAVVGATYPEEAKCIRKTIPKSIFLVPGYGAQGGKAGDVVPCFNEDGYGAIVHSARKVIFAYQWLNNKETEFETASAEAVIRMKEDLTAALKRNNVCPW